MALNLVGAVGDKWGVLSQGIFRTSDLVHVCEGDVVRIASWMGEQTVRLGGIDRDDDLSVAWLDPLYPPSSSEPPRGER